MSGLSDWGVGEWIAFGGLTVTVLGGAITGAIGAVKVSYRFGRHAEQIAQTQKRVESLEGDVDGISKTKEELSGLAATVAALEQTVVRGFNRLDSVLLNLSGPAPARARQRSQQPDSHL